MISREQLARELVAGSTSRPASLQPWLDAGRVEGIDTLLAARWQSSVDLGVADRASCTATLQRAHARELFLQAHERDALSALRAADIDVLVLKGAALARWLYPEPYLRTRSDIDLLLRSEADVVRCRDALLALGYEDLDLPLLPPTYERAYRKPIGKGEHSVDVHWRLSNHPAFAHSFSFNDLWVERQSSTGLPGGWALGPVHALIHACLHRACNLTEVAGDRLIWLYDIALLVPRLSDSDWTLLARLAMTSRTAEPCRHTFAAVYSLFDIAIPHSTMQLLTEVALHEAFRMDHARHLGYRSYWAFRELPWSERVPWLLRRVFPDWRYMQAHFKLKHRGQLPWAWIRRLFDLTTGIGRRH